MAALTRLRARYERLDPMRADAVIAAFFILAWAVELALIRVPAGESRPLTFLAGAVAFTSVAWRRTRPLVACTIFSAVAIAQNAFEASYFFDITTMPFPVLLLLGFSVGRHTEGSRTVAGALVLFAGLGLAIALAEMEFEMASVPYAVFFVAAPTLAGRGYRNRARLQAEQREKAAQAERDAIAQAERAVEVERGRIAAELQAVIANGVSAIVVQAESVPSLIAAGDGATAAHSLATIEETGRDALGEMRRLLGVLRRGDDEAALRAPQPSLARLETLIGEARGRGLDVVLEVTGDRGELAPGIDLSAYRVLQTAFASASEAGAASAVARVDFTDTAVELEVVDARPDPDGPDADLGPLRSRLQIYDGRLWTGRDDGGYAVRARLPREPR